MNALLLLLATQFPDLIDLSAQYTPSADLPHVESAQAQIATYDVTVNVPVPLGPKTFLIPGIAYHVDSVSFAGVPDDFVELRAFHSLELAMLFVQLLPRDWSLALRVAPGLAGDFSALETDLIRFNATALATHAFSEQLVFGFGGLASYAFGSFLPLPALYLDWRPIPELQIETFLPAFLNVRYTFFDRVEVGLRADISGNEYGIRDARIRAQCPNGGSAECLDHVAYSTVTAGATVGVRLFASVWATGLAGFSVWRRLELLNRDDEALVDGGADLPRVFVVRGALTWRIPRS